MLRQKKTYYALSLLVLLIVALLGGLFFVNLRVASRVGGGEALLVPWKASRAFLFEGRSPYGDAVARETQILVYGHPAREGDYPYRLNVPFYLLFFFFPLAFFENFLLARAVWLTLAELALAATLFFNLRLVSWKPSRAFFVLLALFMLGGVYASYALFTGTSAIFLSLLFSAALFAIHEKRDMLAGVLLAMTSMKWEMTALFLLFVFLWMASHRRWDFFTAFAMILFLLLAFSFVLEPSWFFPFLRASYLDVQARFAVTSSLFGVFAKMNLRRPLLFSRIVEGFAALILFLEWRAARGKGFRHFLWAAALTLSLLPFFGISFSPAEYVFLSLPLILVFSVASSRWSRLGFWGGILALLLLWFPFLPKISSEPYLRDSLFLPLPLFLVLSLYWVRWWAIQPPRVFADALMEFRKK